MKIIFYSIFALVACFVGFSLYADPSEIPQSDTVANVQVPSLGVCDEERYLDYFVKGQEIGELIIGQSPGFENLNSREKLRSAFSELELSQTQTVFVVAHEPTATLYPHVCSYRPCSLEEVSNADMQCLRDHLGQCYFVAVHHLDETYCLLYEK